MQDPTLQLVIAENRSAKALIWREVLQDHLPVQVLEISPPQLHSIKGLDAVLLEGLLIHERYGGIPQIGVSQVISTQGEPGMPPWVVTPPPFPANGKWEYGPDGSMYWSSDEKEEWDQQKVYQVFQSVFSAIEQFNKINTRGIHTLGFRANSLFFTGDSRSDAVAVKQAYLDWLGR
jgi:hypothetical protein